MMEPSIGQWDRHRIMASKPLAPTGIPVFVWDIETWGLDATAFAFGCTQNVNTGEERTFFEKEALREYLESQAPCVVYAHNSSRYDTLCLFTSNELYNADKIANGTRIYQIKVNDVQYRDSKHLLNLPLSDIAVSVEMEKGKTPQAYIDGTPRTITDDDIEYCKMDCRILAVALKRFNRLFTDLCGMEPGSAETPLTVASMAYRIWCEMEDSWPENWTWTDSRKRVRKMASCRAVHNELFRLAEHGGRVQVNRPPSEPGEIGWNPLIVQDLVSYDANSLYPSVMYDELFPDLTSMRLYGPSYDTLLSLLASDSIVCMADVRIVAPHDGIPPMLPGSDKENRKNWTVREYEGWLCEPELKLALELGYVIEEVRNLMGARGIRPFRTYVRRLYDLRMEMKAKGDPAAALCKLLMNALFGRYGIKSTPMRIEGDEQIQKAQDSEDFHERYELKFHDGAVGEWPYLLDYGAMRRPPASQWFGFSSFILSYGRERLMRGILAAGDGFAYADTDSVHMTADKAADFEAAIPIGDDLSQWKLETPEPIPTAIYYEPKAYVHFDGEGKRILVRHKGVRTKDDKGNYLPNAGDLTKEQTHRTVVSLYEGLRRNLEPGTPLITTKRSRRFFRE